MKLINPAGQKTVQIQANKTQEIWLEDYESGDRDFELVVELIGDNCICHIQGRAQTTNKDQKNWRIIQRFKGENQTGTITLRGVAEDNSFLHIDGNATLEQSSVDASAQINEKIMLFGNGKGKLLPVLRVETDKVKSASHAASIAPVEAEKLLFFARSGINKKSAEKIIKQGFLM